MVHIDVLDNCDELILAVPIIRRRPGCYGSGGNLGCHRSVPQPEFSSNEGFRAARRSRWARRTRARSR